MALGGIFVAAIGARATLALAGGITLLTTCVGVGLGLYRGRKTDRVEAVALPPE